jgi:hypothetical protein
MTDYFYHGLTHHSTLQCDWSNVLVLLGTVVSEHGKTGEITMSLLAEIVKKNVRSAQSLFK